MSKILCSSPSDLSVAIKQAFKKNDGFIPSAICENIDKSIYDEALRFKALVLNNIKLYYRSYTSHAYGNWKGRTGSWLNALNDPVITKSAKGSNSVTARLDWNDNAWHPSVMPGGGSGFIPAIYEYGWKHKRSRSRKMFNYFDVQGYGTGGVRPINTAAKQFEADNKYNIKIKLDGKKIN